MRFKRHMITSNKSAAESIMETLKMKEQLLNKVEIIVAKGQIAHHEECLLLSRSLQKSYVAEVV